ncbi:uncharacterized protein N7459_000560 [Penicillium hispanicum]|uniref:uncharacterized protein n=1 Tax=Penicillium hispanicum TaxID=1080232 RepID=UPI00253FB65D|nr:uncharacterized protein N7459_000560 [Penicillium hispanicum]KAJ5594352.1 hypothetical protein N7459_000560 [Penicillium hispanicum]
MSTQSDPIDTSFTVFIRLPFPRGDFVDPPPFLLQQAAWLYDRQLSQVRAQMRKVGTTQSTSPSPVPGSVSGSTALAAPAQKGAAPTATSGHGRRTSSTSTTTINQVLPSRDPSRTDTPTAEGREQRWESLARRPSVTRREQPPPLGVSFLRSPPLEEEDLTSSSEESDSESDGASRRAPRFRRFGKFSTQRAGLRDDEDDEDDVPAFLPMSREAEPGPRDRATQELSATLRLDAERVATARRRIADRSGSRVPVASESSTSSMSSGAPVVLPRGDSHPTTQVVGTLGSQRAGEAPRQSPRKSTTSGREASDGTPSMGSSFSDLDGEFEPFR